MPSNCGAGEDSLRVSWTARRSNQSIWKEIHLEYSLEGLMLNLKLQYFGHLMWRADSEKDLDVGKGWRQEEKGTTEDEMVGWHHQLNGHEFEQTWKIVEAGGAWWARVHRVTKSQIWLSNWTTATTTHGIFMSSPWVRRVPKVTLVEDNERCALVPGEGKSTSQPVHGQAWGCFWFPDCFGARMGCIWCGAGEQLDGIRPSLDI